MATKERLEKIYPIDLLRLIRQHSGYACGPASIRMMLHCYGIEYSEQEIVKYLMGREKQNGIDWDDVREFFDENLNIRTSLYYQTTFEGLRNIFKFRKVPIMIAWNPSLKEGFDHFSVVWAVQTETIVLADPDQPAPVTFSKDEFVTRWYGAGLFQPSLTLLR
ncbi:hypothetical protein C5B42_03810 [Candidatus Cerribacteria bacterium 'Amazon FNV 2010 28 9']|uniref:Peptidase C39 domain-containing protein n=1 Tax=Candidatus Cerribacteria bacterium 'Amazon FNV 2010 28 9' TaxID=2081795 RepID=A0A317JN92_9BACT|nr:MAG: hypothetical protein C5B42_03810 [Candidatus Cerribacteria bacterium 'Amazon FNV 2010 28 9']